VLEAIVELVGARDRRPARVSPDVDRARDHTHRWARDMGLVADEPDPERLALWDDAGFAAMDFGLFAATTHPDATGPVLDLLADWYVWLFYVDDVVNLVHDREGMPAVKDLLARVVARMPPSGGGPTATVTSAPVSPPERGAVDVHARTAELRSAPWMDRMTAHMRETLDEMRWTIANQARGRMPNPIEQVEARRGYGGVLWATDMVELGCGLELDPATVALRPVRLLREALADAVALRNDLVSYRKEVEAGETSSNMVAILQHFLACDLGTAARLVADLFAARLDQFDHLVAVDLPEVIADLAIDPATRARIDRTVEGLRDWLAGDEHWALTSGRYLRPTKRERALLAHVAPILGGPTGLGTSAARPTRPTSSSTT
jgi:germacradienol/geosmin synthase